MRSLNKNISFSEGMIEAQQIKHNYYQCSNISERAESENEVFSQTQAQSMKLKSTKYFLNM